MRSLLPVLLPFLFVSVLAAAESPEYVAVRSARPDGRTVAVKDLTLTRDVYRFRFTNGTFHFLAPFQGRTFGAVFIGDGSYELKAANETERRHLALVTGEKDFEILTDSFDKLVLLFSDSTADELSKAGTVVSGAPDARATQVYESYLNDQKRLYRTNLHLRVLRDLLDPPAPASSVFLAPVDGKKYAPALIVFDRRGITALGAGFAGLSGEESAFLSTDMDNGGFWYLNNAAGTASGARGSAPKLLADASEYEIETAIESNLEIKGTTTIRFRANDKAFRVLPLNILPKLRLLRATYTPDGGPSVDAPIVQEEVALGKMARLFRDEVADADAAVILASAHEAGKSAVLQLEYEGREILQSLGGDSYSVRARESWYPNLGTFSDPAIYNLTYRFPRKNHLISTGTLENEKEDGNRKVSVWKSDVPMRVAGFNYGRFEKISRQDAQSGASIDVYTTPDRKKFAQDSMADAINSARVATLFFGKHPYGNVSVTQQAEWSFGQSWPTLIYLPGLALTSSTERMEMFEEAGPAVFEINEFAKMVGWHEYAHQWWGHAVGWQTYRDQWLSEGFAEFTSALALQLTESFDKYDDFWERRRREILNRSRTGVAPNDAGPISQGFRLYTKRSPSAVSGVLYGKGGYVLHMLRMLMRDHQSRDRDAKFMAMMQDFVKTQTGKNPSTADFRTTVERHMTPQMNAAGDNTMNWFFDQWVFGNFVPRFKSTLTVQPSATPGKYRLTGTVTQEEVPADFRSVVPLYVDFGGKKETVYLGSLRVIGTTPEKVDAEIGLPKAPKRIVVNAFHDVLARD